MGIHVTLANVNGDYHPDWDYVRHAGDREIPDILDEMQTVDLPRYDDFCRRPKDIGDFRRRLADVNGDMNSERWDHLCKLLTDNPDFGLSWSY